MKVANVQNSPAFTSRVLELNPKIEIEIGEKLGSNILSMVKRSIKQMKAIGDDTVEYSFGVERQFKSNEVLELYPQGFPKGGIRTEEGIFFTYLIINGKKQVTPNISGPKHIIGKLWDKVKLFFSTKEVSSYVLIQKENIENPHENGVAYIISKTQKLLKKLITKEKRYKN